MNIILDFEKAENNSILEFNKKVKKICQTFKSQSINLDLIFPELKIKCVITQSIHDNQKFHDLSIHVLNHDGTKPDLSSYLDLFENEIFNEYINNPKQFIRNPVIMYGVSDNIYDKLIDYLCNFIFLFFKSTKNSYFL